MRAIKLSPIELFRLSFLVSFAAIAIVVAAYIIFIGSSSPGSANILMEGSDVGDGTIDVDVRGDSQLARLMAHNSTDIDLRYKKTIAENEKLAAELSLVGDGSRKTKAVITNKNGDAAANIFVDRMKGYASVQAEAYIETNEEDGTKFDLNYVIEGQQKSWHGNFFAYDEFGRPSTEESVRGSGNLTEWRHYNVTNPPQTSEDFLWFCAGINRDVIISDEPNAVYIAPDGYTADKDGTLWKNDKGYYINESGNRTVINTTEQA